MSVDELKQSYLHNVCSEIHGLELQHNIEHELSQHIEDQYLDLLSEIQDEEKAMNKALLQTGDPLALGKQMDKIHNPSPRWYVYLLTGLLLLFIYDKSIIHLIDPPSLYLLIPIGSVIAFGVIKRKRGWKSNRLIIAKSFVAAGILISLPQLIYSIQHYSILQQESLFLIYMRISMIPSLYGLVINILITVIKPRKTRRLKQINE